MNQKSQKRLRLIKHGYRNRIDPRVRERQIKNLLADCFENRWWLPSGSKELAAAIYCAAVFLQDVIALTHLSLWKSLQNQMASFPAPPERDLVGMRQRLKNPNASMHDLIGAMDLGTFAVRSMLARFPSAKFHPDEDWDLEETDDNEGEEQEEEKYEEKNEWQRKRTENMPASSAPHSCRSWPKLRRTSGLL